MEKGLLAIALVSMLVLVAVAFGAGLTYERYIGMWDDYSYCMPKQDLRDAIIAGAGDEGVRRTWQRAAARRGQ